MSRQNPEEIGGDLPSDLEGSERKTLSVLGVRLTARRAVPNPAFRGDLRRRLGDLGRGRRGQRVEAVHALVASYVASGLLLLVVGAAGLAGIGPFASG